MKKATNNKLSVYLVKEKIESPEEILKMDDLSHIKISSSSEFYYGISNSGTPQWLQFFSTSDEVKAAFKNKVHAKIAKAVLLVNTSGRRFAITFGYGRHLLRQESYEQRFGLEVALGTIEPDGIRYIDKKDMAHSQKIAHEQIHKDSTVDDFSIDSELDILRGVTGSSNVNKFIKYADDREGKRVSVSGKDALSLAINVELQQIKPFLDNCYGYYKRKEYKKNFEWIDHVAEISDRSKIKELDNLLLKNISDRKLDKIWMAIPEIIKWEDVSEFKFKKNSFGDDLDLDKYFDFLNKKKHIDLSIFQLKKDTVDCISATTDTKLDSWNIYSCLHCELNIDDSVYILSGGKWYRIEQKYSITVQKDFKNIKKKSIKKNLPNRHTKEWENSYNKRIADSDNDMHCMDCNNIPYGGRYQQIEFCDLFTKSNEIIHVKRYGSSSVLSHLFNQGVVSGQLFTEEGFRKKLNKELPNGFKLPNYTKKPDPTKYKIIYAIIYDKKNDFEIPFFSKVSLRNAVKSLKAFGYTSISLLEISTEKDKELSK